MPELTERTIGCPYCGEAISILVDESLPEQQYAEDCQVCCMRSSIPNREQLIAMPVCPSSRHLPGRLTVRFIDLVELGNGHRTLRKARLQS